MKIQDVVLAAIICSHIQIADASHYVEFVDPTDMEHYDQRSKSSQFTLKEKLSQDIFKGFLQRLLKSAQSWDVDIRDEKLGVVYTKMEIEKFLNNEDWDPDKLQLILQNVDFTKDKGVDFWTLFLSCVLSGALAWIMGRYNWTRPDQNLEANTPNEQVEENFSFPVPDTGLNEHIQNVRRESHSEPAAKQDQLDKRPSQSFQMSERSARGKNQAESNKQDTVTSVQTKADSLSNMQNIPEPVTTLRDMESTDSPNYHQELLSSDAEGTSEEKANVDTGLDTHYPQDTSMNADYESDFILISESAPGSLVFDQERDSDESV